jgi:PIN domain nuclease of toxin-antitoxin system
VGNEPVIVLDTHVLVWWASGTRISPRASRAVQTALRRGPLHASTISVMEIATAVRRGRLSFAVPVADWLRDLLRLPEIRLQPVSAEIAELAGTLGDSLHGDPADRIIVATARSLGARLVTADARLRGSNDVQAVW